MKPFEALYKMTLSRRVEKCERDDDGCWVYLKSGWNNGDGGEHAIHEDSWLECWEKFQLVEKCSCPDCKSETKGPQCKP